MKIIPERRFTATVKLTDGTLYSTTVYGPNPYDAETNYKRQCPGVEYVAVHSEQMSR